MPATAPPAVRSARLLAALAPALHEPRLPDWIARPVSFEPPRPRTRHRTVFVSDLHLGTAGTQADAVAAFLNSVECDTLYLVGDIFDGWALKRGWHWPAAHNEVLRRILKMAHHGTRVIYVPGNHDEVFRDYAGMDFGGIEVRLEAVHTTADGRRLLILHGDRFDAVVLYHRWLALFADWAYTALLKANRGYDRVRRTVGLPYWSLSAYAKRKVKNAVQFITSYEEAVADAATEAGADGVVCGHIHTAEMRTIGAIAYHSCGDWVESCTALVEHEDGRIELIDWRAREALRELAAAAT